MGILQRVNYSGLVVALSGFGITRFFVAETVRIDATLSFVIAGLVPLIVGLVLTVYGVALSIGPFTSEYANTVARWHVLGVGAMAAVFAITGIDQLLRTGSVGIGLDAPLLVANVLLGGAVGGTLTGIRTGRLNEQQRTIRRSANRARLVNRLLRHEVLNAVTIIGGHADILSDDTNEDATRRRSSMAAIRSAVNRIKSTIEEVGTVTKNETVTGRVDIEEVVREECRRIEDEYGIDIDASIETGETEIAATERIGVVVRELLENAAVHGDNSPVRIELTGTADAVEVSIVDDGPGLPDIQRRLLEDSDFPAADDPTAGFGLQIVRLLVSQFGGEIRVRNASEEAEGETAVTVILPRTETRRSTVGSVGVSFPNLNQALAGGILGGVVMGAFYQLSTGLLPVIGALYGIETPVVGWVTHLFHSAVFGLLFVAIAAHPQVNRGLSGPLWAGLLGVGWGTILWFAAAGVLMPMWLSFVGLPARIPTLTLAGFVGHALWGAVLGVMYWKLDALDVGARLGAYRRRHS